MQLRLERQFDAKAGKVFSAIERGLLFASCGKSITKLDFQPGGKYDLRYRQNDSISGEFLSIDPAALIRFTWSQSGQVAIRLTDHEQGSTLELVHEQIPTEKLLAQFTAGWTDGLDTFARKLQEQS